MRLAGKEAMTVDDKEKALRKLLELIAEHTDLAERITITIKPSKVTQSDAKPKDETK